MQNKTDSEKRELRRVKYAKFAKKAAQAALGGASLGTMVGSAFLTVPLASVVGAVIGALAIGTIASAIMEVGSDEDEDTAYDEESE